MQLNFQYMRRDTQSGKRGFALVSVLWGLVVVSLIAGSMLQLRKSSTYAERDAHKRAELEMVVQAGINRAILGLTDIRADKRWRVDGVPTSFSFNEIPVTLIVQDELGKIDINAADRDTFVRLFQSVGVTQELTATLADRVLDWRSSNGLTHLNGSTDEDYKASGAKYLPRHKAFQSVDELQMVMGITPDMFQRLRPALTVYSQRPQISQETAPREVLLTLPGMNVNSIEKMLNDRLNSSITPSGLMFVRPGVIDPHLPLDGRSFTISATCQVGQKVVVHEEVIRITNSAARPFLVLMWR
jgi:general secretion pathway protein K